MSTEMDPTPVGDRRDVVVVSVIECRPGCADALLAAFEETIPLVHGEEGCLMYALHRADDAPDRFVFVEKWASREALDAHDASPHIQDLVAKAGALLAGAPAITLLAAVPVGDAAKGAL